MEDPDDIIEEVVNHALDEHQGVVGSYVVVAEVIDGTSTTLAIAVSDGTLPWVAEGMLSRALDRIANVGMDIGECDHCPHCFPPDDEE